MTRLKRTAAGVVVVAVSIVLWDALGLAAAIIALGVLLYDSFARAAAR